MGAYAELPRHEAFAAQLVVANLDCAQLARAINMRYGTPAKPQVVSRQFLSRLKNGDAKRCTPVLAERICKEVGVALPMLFDMHGVHNADAQNAQRVA